MQENGPFKNRLFVQTMDSSFWKNKKRNWLMDILPSQRWVDPLIPTCQPPSGQVPTQSLRSVFLPLEMCFRRERMREQPTLVWTAAPRKKTTELTDRWWHNIFFFSQCLPMLSRMYHRCPRWKLASRWMKLKAMREKQRTTLIHSWHLLP